MISLQHQFVQYIKQELSDFDESEQSQDQFITHNIKLASNLIYFIKDKVTIDESVLEVFNILKQLGLQS